jgi:hypothetical protein
MRKKINKSLYNSIVIIFLASCGGGGGGGGGSTNGGGYGGGGYGSTNSSPNITNQSASYSIIEEQTSAFTVTASDADNDSLTFTISGVDAGLFNITSSGGVVTFTNAPDFESPSDNDSNNAYQITATVSDGNATDSMAFTLTVTNDTSDDTTSSNYDGVLIRDGYIQSATVCMPIQDGNGVDTCDGATYTTTTNTNGSFTLEIDESNTETVTLLAEGGFNPITNDAEAYVMSLKDPTTEQNLVISPLSTLVYGDNRFTYESLKESLGVDTNFMIRFDDPYLNVIDTASNKAALVNTQLLIMYETLNLLQILAGASNLTAVSTINDMILNRDDNIETSLGDTTLVKDILLDLDLPDYTITNAQLENLSGSFSSFLQKVYVDSSNEQAYFTKTARDHVVPLLLGILDDTVNNTEIDQIIFDTLDWVSDKTSRTNIEDVENFTTTSYSVSNSGSAYYTVDGINASSTALVIYAKVGDVINFVPAGSSVFTAHPFEMSTSQNDTAGINNIGSNEGWDQSNTSLTVTANTPTVLYPHCGVHSGMYTNGKIEIVTTFDQSKIDIGQATSALEVQGTVSEGPFKGASGYTHNVYLRQSDAGESQHSHEFKEYPGITFYMPADQGYHGKSTSTGMARFKTKSHY